jgi:alpha-tubulin suppressor-like RCC1 family protein
MLLPAGTLLAAGAQEPGKTPENPDTLRRVSAMRARVTAVAAANRHTVALAEGGGVFSWGCNLQGQLGYGTSDSASNAVPRVVEAVKARAETLNS